jgi:hypothetical protein
MLQGIAAVRLSPCTARTRVFKAEEDRATMRWMMVDSRRPSAKWGGLAAGLFCASCVGGCGGTTGTEHIVADNGSSAVPSDASMDASDASVRVRDASFAEGEAGYDPFGDASRSTPTRPDPKADHMVPQPQGMDALAGGPDVSMQVQDAGMPEAEAEAEVPRRTTKQILDMWPGCYDCAVYNGCFDPEFGGTDCEMLGLPDSGAAGSGQDEEAFCIDTLETIVGSKCAEGMSLVPCLCGKTDVTACQLGTATPTGPCYDLYATDLGGSNGSLSLILVNFTFPRLGAGAANGVVQCAQAFTCSCFSPIPDGGFPTEGGSD